MKVYQKIAQKLQAMKNCQENKNNDWYYKHMQDLQHIENNTFPHGSGFDGECYIDKTDFEKNKYRIHFDWHCMDDYGCYDGWLSFDLIVTPDLQFGFDFKIIWYGCGNCKYKVTKYKPVLEEYFDEVWQEVLLQEIE